MSLAIPESLRIEHDHLHAQLLPLTREEGDIGAAARGVAQRLHPHFVKEEAFALPPLGLLARIAQDGVTPDMAEVLTMTRDLAAELPAMLAEHREIVTALHALARAGERAGRADVVEFAGALTLHAQTEEQVMYPAALLVGERVASALPAQSPSKRAA
ncbi:MAG TPA: hemerythrin domain-containing protein [Casimicrobiaceae bacterium]|nr:hemerythrin domain-containing protein [Casimicrobiaceae bacterium]